MLEGDGKVVAGTVGCTSKDDFGHPSEVGDGNALAPIGEEGPFFTGRAASRFGCVSNETVSPVADTPAVLDGYGNDDVSLTEAVRVPILEFLRMTGCR